MRISGYGFLLTVMVLLALALPPPAHADDDDTTVQTDQMRIVDRGTIKKVLKSDMIMLDNDKRYRLENILVPPFEDEPALDELKHFVGVPVLIYSYHDLEEDQDKNIVPYAHVVTTRGLWIQQDLISKGLAWAFCTETSPQTVGVLKQAEEKARVDHLGFWKDPAYDIKTSDEIAQFVDSYQIVEGQISNVAILTNANTIILNFGKGKKRNFAVLFHIEPQFQALLNDPVTGEKRFQGFDQLKGLTVRVRGWVKDEGNGPMIELTRKEQVDIIMVKD